MTWDYLCQEVDGGVIPCVRECMSVRTCVHACVRVCACSCVRVRV